MSKRRRSEEDEFTLQVDFISKLPLKKRLTHALATRIYSRSSGAPNESNIDGTLTLSWDHLRHVPGLRGRNLSENHEEQHSLLEKLLKDEAIPIKKMLTVAKPPPPPPPEQSSNEEINHHVGEKFIEPCLRKKPRPRKPPVTQKLCCVSGCRRRISPYHRKYVSMDYRPDLKEEFLNVKGNMYICYHHYVRDLEKRRNSEKQKNTEYVVPPPLPVKKKLGRRRKVIPKRHLTRNQRKLNADNKAEDEKGARTRSRSAAINNRREKERVVIIDPATFSEEEEEEEEVKVKVLKVKRKTGRKEKEEEDNEELGEQDDISIPSLNRIQSCVYFMKKNLGVYFMASEICMEVHRLHVLGEIKVNGKTPKNGGRTCFTSGGIGTALSSSFTRGTVFFGSLRVRRKPPTIEKIMEWKKSAKGREHMNGPKYAYSVSETTSEESSNNDIILTVTKGQVFTQLQAILFVLGHSLGYPLYCHEINERIDKCILEGKFALKNSLRNGRHLASYLRAALKQIYYGRFCLQRVVQEDEVIARKRLPPKSNSKFVYYLTTPKKLKEGYVPLPLPPPKFRMCKKKKKKPPVIKVRDEDEDEDEDDDED